VSRYQEIQGYAIMCFTQVQNLLSDYMNSKEHAEGFCFTSFIYINESCVTKSLCSAMKFYPLNEHIRRNKELIQSLNETFASLWCSDCLLHSAGKLLKSNIQKNVSCRKY